MHFLNNRNIKAPILIGHSNGGLILQELLFQNSKENLIAPTDVIFLGSVAWGPAPLLKKLMFDLLRVLGLSDILLLGIFCRISTRRAIKRAFVVETTKNTDITGVNISVDDYCRLVMAEEQELSMLCVHSVAHSGSSVREPVAAHGLGINSGS